MIHFNPHLVEAALNIIHESWEMSDVLTDLNRSNATLSDVPEKENLMKACMRDSELRRKYKTIDRMNDSNCKWFSGSLCKFTKCA